MGDLVLGSEQEEDPEHRQVLDGIFFGIKEGSQELVIGTLAGCVVCRIVTRWPREDAADPVFHSSIRGTPWKLLSDDELREPREPREPLRIDVRPVHADLPPPISTEPSKPRRVYIRNPVELSRHVHTWMHWLCSSNDSRTFA